MSGERGERERQDLAVEFVGDDAPQHGNPLVSAVRARAAGWVVVNSEDGLSRVRPTIDSAAAAGLGVFLRLSDTSLLAEIESHCGAFAQRDPASLRDRFRIVVHGERQGKRLRVDARWAPSALDLSGRTGLRRMIARSIPNFLRAQADCDDLIVPEGLVDPPDRPALAAKLHERGASLWIARTPAHGAVRIERQPGR